jgi:hypothetical protein
MVVNDNAYWLVQRGVFEFFASKLAPTGGFNRRRAFAPESSSAVALLEFLAVAARARVVAADVFQGVAYRLLRGVVAVRAVDMAMVVIMIVVVMIVVAVWAMDMGLLGHRGYSGIRSAGIITPLRARCT